MTGAEKLGRNLGPCLTLGFCSLKAPHKAELVRRPPPSTTAAPLALDNTPSVTILWGFFSPYFTVQAFLVGSVAFFFFLILVFGGPGEAFPATLGACVRSWTPSSQSLQLPVLLWEESQCPGLTRALSPRTRGERLELQVMLGRREERNRVHRGGWPLHSARCLEREPGHEGARWEEP